MIPGQSVCPAPLTDYLIDFSAPAGGSHRQIETHKCLNISELDIVIHAHARHVRTCIISGSNDTGTQANTCSKDTASHAPVNTVTTVTTTAAIFMRGICTELHYHGPDPAFVLAFVGFPACLCLRQMSRLCRLFILSINVNNQTYNIMEACGPFAHRHIDTFFYVCGFVLCFYFFLPCISLNTFC